MSEKHEAVAKIQRYLSDNYHQIITLKALAQTVHYSPWYASKIFKELTGQSIFDYLRKLRLTEAARRLRDYDDRVLDVALDAMFASHEGFTRAFTQTFNITPKAYQKTPIPLQYFIPYEITPPKKPKGDKVMKEAKAVFIQIIERPKRKAIIKRGLKATGYFSYCDEVDCEIWGTFMSIKEAINEPIGMWLSKTLQKPNTSLYVQGVEVPKDYQGKIPDGCELIDLPETLMMVFQSEPYDDENFEEEVSLAMKHIASYNPQVYGYTYDENGYRFQYEPQGYRGYIEGRTVIPLKK